jgi:hypothetical protein
VFQLIPIRIKQIPFLDGRSTEEEAIASAWKWNRRLEVNIIINLKTSITLINTIV